MRLCGRYCRLMATGKRQTVVTVAIAREMSAFRRANRTRGHAASGGLIRSHCLAVELHEQYERDNDIPLRIAGGRAPVSPRGKLCGRYQSTPAGRSEAAKDEQTEMRYPIRASEFANRRQRPCLLRCTTVIRTTPPHPGADRATAPEIIDNEHHSSACPTGRLILRPPRPNDCPSSEILCRR